MAQSIEKMGKTIEEAYQAALLELGAKENEVQVEILEEPSKGFLGFIGTKKARIRVTKISTDSEKTQEEIKKEIGAAIGAALSSYDSNLKVATKTLTVEEKEERLKKGIDFLEAVFKALKIEISIKIVDKGDHQLLELIGKEIGILIGKHGKTLDALQYITNLIINKKENETRLLIVLDIENYRKRREETLSKLAIRLAEKIKYTQKKIMLEPMNRHERKIIHLVLQNYPYVRSYSSGDEPYRKIIIEYQEPSDESISYDK